MNSAAPKSRTRKKSVAAVEDDDAGGDGGYEDEAETEVEAKPDDAARRIFRGVRLPETPIFTLESASDPNLTIDFRGVRALPGMPAMRLAADGISIDTLPDFFRQILGDEQFEDFKEFADDPDNGITLDVLIDLAKFLMEMYTGRPTKRSSRS